MICLGQHLSCSFRLGVLALFTMAIGTQVSEAQNLPADRAYGICEHRVSKLIPLLSDIRDTPGAMDELNVSSLELQMLQHKANDARRRLKDLAPNTQEQPSGDAAAGTSSSLACILKRIGHYSVEPSVQVDYCQPGMQAGAFLADEWPDITKLGISFKFWAEVELGCVEEMA